MQDDIHSVTRCLRKVHEGESGAEDRLLELVYAQLRRMAGVRMRKERPNHTLQPTELVNEVYLRLLGALRSIEWQNSAHFYALCALTMSRILADHARKRIKEGVKVELLPGLSLTEERSHWLMDFEESLEKLERFDKRGADVVRMSYFMGLSQSEIAETLDVTVRTVRRDLASCEAWLRSDMSSSRPANRKEASA